MIEEHHPEDLHEEHPEDLHEEHPEDLHEHHQALKLGQLNDRWIDRRTARIMQEDLANQVKDFPRDTRLRQHFAGRTSRDSEGLRATCCKPTIPDHRNCGQKAQCGSHCRVNARNNVITL